MLSRTLTPLILCAPVTPMAKVSRKAPAQLPKPTLRGKIALVAGATRGAGRGIAVALGEAGATDYSRLGDATDMTDVVDRRRCNFWLVLRL